MSEATRAVTQLAQIYTAARANDDGTCCMVAPHPSLKKRIQQELADARARATTMVGPFLRAGEPQRPGFNDGLILPPETFPLGTPMRTMRSAAANRAPLRGVVRVVVVLVDFPDRAMVQSAEHFRNLFFSRNVLPTKSVREYYDEVTNGLVDIQGEVVGPIRLQTNLADYAHGASGIGDPLPNAATMARDAAAAADPNVNFTPFDNDGNGFVDAFIVVHAGPGAEVTGKPNDIWSHKWTIDGGAMNVDQTRIFGYLTVPEDAKIGVCAHELGHLLFGFPDLYDTDGTSEGIGDWCLMAAGSWGGDGDTPVHPSAWCKLKQQWAKVENLTGSTTLQIADVKDSQRIYRFWDGGAPGDEYFLVENRQRNRFDQSLPAEGLLIWHIDDSIDGNRDETHYKVALMQADGRRDLERNQSRGDGGDCYPGTSGNTAFTDNSTPSSKSYGGVATNVAVSRISGSGAVMTANVSVVGPMYS